jgi:hypothetical protein
MPALPTVTPTTNADAYGGPGEGRCRDPPDGLEHLFRVVWFFQRQTTRHWTGHYWRKSSRVDHRQSWVVLATAFGDLPPVNFSGQLDIGHQQVCGSLLAPFQSFLSVARLDNVVTFIPQRLSGEFANQWVVLNKKYAHRGSSAS